ncbi:hypothetical protein ACRBLZ_000476 [Campylobacter upsaliensis]|uniref:Uncharacterized protein n=1 Tax=Campylobacter upsaliensis TaxID=28080 RepID=A0A5L8T7Z8_CAMUP|nr:hypothetical protein [Campylobacter upsaliensis]EAI8054137.1 hypothetical protein [Campylobacter upsaliensis]EAJ4502902.1 hypothetical protein [Campylobacter upsaliensis]EAJ5079792.1 hypothetical protein [Campylobacter upsaliensis]EAK0955159.1 hypothetical protein [Campylobacter upsaliensis]EAK2502809.1 hypothetical protein [Campylobacter upsaliensis]
MEKNLTAKELEILEQEKVKEITLMVEAFSNLEDGVPLFDFENASENEKQAILKQLAEFSNYDEDIPLNIQEEWQ